MTIVACDRKSLVSDGWVSYGSLNLSVPKTWRKKDLIIGVAGTYETGIIFYDWYMKHGAHWDKEMKPPMPRSEDGDFSALILDPAGIYQCGPQIRVFRLFQDCAAIGMGAEFAMGAMSMGASPERAVELTCKHIAGCGGDVTVNYLETNPRTMK